MPLYPNGSPMLGMSGMGQQSGPGAVSPFGQNFQQGQQFQDPNAWLANMQAQIAAGQGQQPSAAAPQATANPVAPAGNTSSQVPTMALPPDPLTAQAQQQPAAPVSGQGAPGPLASQAASNALLASMLKQPQSQAAAKPASSGLLGGLFNAIGL